MPGPPQVWDGDFAAGRCNVQGTGAGSELLPHLWDRAGGVGLWGPPVCPPWEAGWREQGALEASLGQVRARAVPSSFPQVLKETRPSQSPQRCRLGWQQLCPKGVSLVTLTLP